MLEPAATIKGRTFPGDFFAYGCQIHVDQKHSVEITSTSSGDEKLQHFRFQFSAPGATPDSLTWLHHISEGNSEEKSWYSVGRTDDGYLIRFEKGGDFLVHPDSDTIECRPAPEADEDTLQHLLLNQVLPRLIAQQGDIVLHAGAVALADDTRAIAFIGNTGSGKSTLSTLFSKHGASLLTDDCLRIKLTDGDSLAIPAYPSIRFWQDDHGKLLPESHGSSASQSSIYNCKLCLQFDQFPYQFCNHPVPLSGLYLLCSDQSEHDDISITPASKSETVSFLTANCFRLDVEDLTRLENEFHHLIDLARKVPAFRLTYPKNWDRIEDLRIAILNHEKSIP